MVYDKVWGKTGVRDVGIALVMRKASVDKRRGIRWNLTTELEDLDFADDIA